jgi:hypothetical protein
MAQMEKKSSGTTHPKRNGPPSLVSLCKPMKNLHQGRPEHSQMGAFQNWQFFGQRSLLFAGELSRSS